MTSLLKSIFGGGGGGMQRSPSFDDFSSGASKDAHEEYAKEHPEAPSIINPPKEKLMGTSPSRNSVWQGVFNPGRNYSDNMKNIGNQYFDHIPEDQKKGEYSVWEHVVKGERMKVFHQFDRDHDGFLDAEDLRKSLGESADVMQLIKAADKNGDGKIDYSEFCELLRNS